MNSLDLAYTWFAAATVRGALLAVTVLLVQAAVGSRMPARWRFALWLPVVFVLAMPSLPKSRWSVENVFHLTAPQAAPLATLGETSPESASIPRPVPLPVPALSRRPGLQDLTRIVWLAGVAGAMSLMLGGYALTMRRIRRGAMPADASLVALLAEIARENRISHPPRLLVSTGVLSPAVTGLFRASLLLPAGFPGAFTPSEARLVLLHELSHLKRHDLLLNWLLCLLQAIHWCNPLLWFAFARMRADREAACDAQVLTVARGDCRADYGHALLKLESAFAHGPLSLGFVGIFERSAGIRSRIDAIARHRRAHPAWAPACIGLISALLVAGGTRAQDRVQDLSAGAPGAIQAAERAPAESVTLTPAGQLRAKLSSIIIPRIEFKELTLAEALELIALKSVEFDPAKTGVKIVLKLDAAEALRIPGLDASRITLALKNVPLNVLMDYATRLANVRFRIEAQGIVVVPLNSPDPVLPIKNKEWRLDPQRHPRLYPSGAAQLKALMIGAGISFPEGTSIQISEEGHRMLVKNSAEAFDQIEDFLASDRASDAADKLRQANKIAQAEQEKKVRRKLDTILLSSIEFRGATLLKAVDFLKKKSNEMDMGEEDPAKRGVNFVVFPLAQAPERIVTMKLSNVSLGEAVRVLCEKTNREWEVSGNAVRIRPLPPAPPVPGRPF